jgi:enolase
MNPANQKEIDKTMIELDGKNDKSGLGANAILSVSLAVCRASASDNNVPLYKYISDISGVSADPNNFPLPMFNVLNGGKHSDSGLSVQEFLIIPTGIESFPEQLQAGSEIFHHLKKILEKEELSTSVGDEGGFAPKVQGTSAALDLIVQAIKESRYLPGTQINIGLDAAANSFYVKEEDRYFLKPEGIMMNRETLINIYREFVDKYYVISLEDGLNEEDWEGWKMLMEKIGNKPLLEGVNKKIIKEHMIIGDDLLVTNVERLRKAIDKKACNSVLVKVNQIGTLTETIECVKLARKNKMKTIISHRSGETTDDFIADLAVGIGSDFIKTGSLSRGERIAKYNRLLKIYGEIKN